MDARIIKLDWPIPDRFEAVTTNVDAVFTELLILHHSSERTSLQREVRGNIVVKSREPSGRRSVHIYKVRQASTIELVAIDSDKVMTQAEIDIVADSLADFLLQNYLKRNMVPRA